MISLLRPALVILTAQLLTASTLAQSPADRLLNLVPEDAGISVLVENFRERRAPFLQSSTATEIVRSPEVRAWWNTHGKQPWDALQASIKAATGEPVETIVDKLFGDAVVLSIHTPQDGGPESAKGLFLLAARDPALLKRLVEQINNLEKRSGTLVEVSTRKKEQGAYFVRRFRPGTKADEAYAILDDSILAWSNSENLIGDVLKRRATGQGLASSSRFKTVRGSLPDDSLLSLFIDPRFVERMASRSPKADKRTEGETRLLKLFGRYLSAVQYAGASVVWRDGPAVETFESVAPEKLDSALRKWSDQAQGRERLLARVPATALWIIAARIDLVASLDLVLDVVPEADRERVDRLLEVARGLLLGKDLRTEILPGLGPGVIGFADLAESSGPEAKPALVVGVEIRKPDDARPALENALRTVFNLLALDDKKTPDEVRLQKFERGGDRIVSLGTTPKSVAFAVTSELLAIGNDPERIAEFIAARTPASAPSPFVASLPEKVAKAGGFAVVNLDLVLRRVAGRRDKVAGDLNLSVSDLDGLLAAGRLFRLGYFTTTVSQDSASVRRSLGMIGKPARR